MKTKLFPKLHSPITKQFNLNNGPEYFAQDNVPPKTKIVPSIAPITSASTEKIQNLENKNENLKKEISELTSQNTHFNLTKPSPHYSFTTAATRD